MGKDIAKSIRISQEAFDYIDSAAGSSFNDKLNGLIYLMGSAVPEKKKELRFVDACIEKRKKELVDLRLKIDRFRGCLNTCDCYLSTLDRVLADALAQFDIPPAGQ